MSKKYNVIYADCPWPQKGGPKQNGYTVVDGKQVWNSEGKSLDLPYTTMTIEQIKALNVKSITADDAHLYFWVTNKHLPSAFEIIKNWGFKYSITLVWAKNRMGGGLGGTYRVTTEFLIFATKGKLKALKSIDNTWFNVKRDYVNGYPKHSKKPEFFRQIIENVSPGSKLELFAREESEGWDVYGNEVKNSIII